MSLFKALMVFWALAVSLGFPLIRKTRWSSPVCFVCISTLYGIFISLIFSPLAPISFAAVYFAVLISFVSRSSFRARILLSLASIVTSMSSLGIGWFSWSLMAFVIHSAMISADSLVRCRPSPRSWPLCSVIASFFATAPSYLSSSISLMISVCLFLCSAPICGR